MSSFNLSPPPTPPATPPGDEGPNDPNSRRAGRLALITAIVVLSAAIITAITTGGVPKVWREITDQPPPPPRATATIVSPADIAVPHVVQLFGSYQNLPPDTVIWAVSQDMTTNMLYPQDKPCSIDDGQFNCGNYYLGSDTGHGENITILIVTATAQAANSFSRYEITKGGPLGNNPGLDTLPAGTNTIGSKQVVRS